MFETRVYRVRRLSQEDAPLVSGLGAHCQAYLELHYGAPADPSHLVRELLSDLPPGRSLEDKWGLGLFDDAGHLLGGLDVVRDHPEPGEWYLGLLILAPGQRGEGRGTALLEDLVGELRRRGARGLRLAVSEHNPAGLRFWTRQGFTPVRQVLARFGHQESVFHVLRRALEASS